MKGGTFSSKQYKDKKADADIKHFNMLNEGWGVGVWMSDCYSLLPEYFVAGTSSGLHQNALAVLQGPSAERLTTETTRAIVPSQM